MRRIPQPLPEEWLDTLPLSERITFEMTEVLCLLGKIGAQVRTREGRSLRWMETSLDCAFADADRILRVLERSTDR